jgi:hypothetical protein
MNSVLRYLELQAKAKTGLSSSVAVWAGVAVVGAAVTFGFVVLTAFIWLAERYSPLTAALILGAFFLLLTIIALVACKIAQGRNVQEAKIALAARSNQPWLDPRYFAVGMQAVRAIGLRRIVPLVAVGMLAAGLAKEWGARRAPSDDSEAAESGAEDDSGEDREAA